MLRLTELRLPLDHTEEELRAAILRELGIEPRELAGYSIFRRSFDARKKGCDRAHLPPRRRDDRARPRSSGGFADDPHVGPTPDTSYRFVARGAGGLRPRGRW